MSHTARHSLGTLNETLTQLGWPPRSEPLTPPGRPDGPDGSGDAT